VKVKLLTAMAGADFSHVAGDIVDMPDDEAEAYIANGFAEAPPAPAKKRAASKPVED